MFFKLIMHQSFSSESNFRYLSKCKIHMSFAWAVYLCTFVQKLKCKDEKRLGRIHMHIKVADSEDYSSPLKDIQAGFTCTDIEQSQKHVIK